LLRFLPEPWPAVPVPAEETPLPAEAGKCHRPRETANSQRDGDMHEGNNMGIRTTFTKNLP